MDMNNPQMSPRKPAAVVNHRNERRPRHPARVIRHHGVRCHHEVRLTEQWSAILLCIEIDTIGTDLCHQHKFPIVEDPLVKSGKLLQGFPPQAPKKPARHLTQCSIYIYIYGR